MFGKDDRSMDIVIPHSLQIVLDDVGWFCGKDDRKAGGPSRTGISRYHVADDYKAINELGSILDMKINCAFIVGEWDPDNRLRKIPCLSKYGDDWDNIPHLDKKEMAKIADIINNSPYIDLAIHGLLHGYYKDGIDNWDSSDYYYHINKKLIMTEEAEIRNRLDAFFDLIKYYNINKKINSFVPPSFVYRWNEISNILVDYGVDYVSTIFRTMEYNLGEKPEIADVENGIVTIDRNNNKVPWDQIDSPFDHLPVMKGICGIHWPNILNPDPAKNSETVQRIAGYFKKCSQEFGVILSKDMRFSATQSLYKRFSDVTYENGKAVIDLSRVPLSDKIDKCFYVSSKGALTYYSGCSIEEHERKIGFINYKITPRSDTVILGM